MRILSISGQNIASLAARFDIDFTAAPLNGAGLFAITGDTGAGKSSILDAMCLALYGEAPRLAAGAAGDEVPDPGGEPIKARDARAILRRGAAGGWAEVRFMAPDGETYIARWQARRARDRLDGKLQAVARSVVRARDGQVLASQSTAAADLVRDLSGLSYDEFRRTVLLAQGEFDAFLRADTAERAALLEKVTGTGLYRAVSVRIYERTEAARAAHDTLVLRRGEHRLLSPEGREALAAERTELARTNAAAEGERATIAADLARHTRLAEARTRLAAAEAEAARAAEGVAAAEPQRARLAFLDRAEPLRPLWQAREDAARHLAACTADRVAAAEAEARAVEGASRAAEIAKTAADALALREAEFKAMGRDWDRAADLDSRIATARDEALDAAGKSRILAEKDTEARGALADLAALMARAEAAETAAVAATERLARFVPLAEGWDRIARDLADRAAAKADERKAVTAASALAGQADRTAADLRDLDRADTLDRAQREATAAEAAEVRAGIARIEAGAPQDRAAHLSGLATLLDRLEGARRLHDAADAAGRRAEAAGVMAEAEAEAARAGIAAADTEIALAEASAAALAAPAERADLALSDMARHLRLRLEPGEPCPVCGARDHAADADSAFEALATSLRADLAAARTLAGQARDRRTRAAGALAAAEAQARQAATEGETARNQALAAAQDWAAALSAALALSPALPLPDAPAGAADALAAARTASDAERAGVLASLRDLDALRQSLAALDLRRDGLAAAMEARGGKRTELAAVAAQVDRDRALALERAAAAAARCAALETVLLPVLETAGEPTDTLDTDAALPGRLAARVAEVAAARAEATRSAAARAALAPRLAAAQGAAAAAAKAAAEAAGDAAKRKAALDALTTERAGLLGGETTEAHRSRFNRARLAAQEDYRAAQAAVAAAEAARGSAAGAHAAARAALDRALDGTGRAGTAFDAALAAAGLTAEALAALLDAPKDQADILRRSLRALDDAVTAAASALAARRDDLARAEAQGIPDRPPDDLEAALAALDAVRAGRQERMGAIAGILDADAAARDLLAGLETLIAKARADLDVWQAVNAAAGSRSGDRFARIAQQVTLDVLVTAANGHLADLAPRYRLRRAADLALHVEDRDMGGEARATRSLSGGERFLVSLSLALALSRMGGRGGLAATLFIDEGFGTLDAASLDLAIDALETLRSQGRQVGVISHVEAMKDRIPVRIEVRRLGGGRSSVTVGGGQGTGRP